MKSKTFFKMILKELLSELEDYDELITANKWENEQWVLDFYDELNKISIRK